MVLTEDSLIALAAAVLAGATVAALVLALRGAVLARWSRDVAWIERTIARMTSARADGRPLVAAWYAAVVLGFLAAVFVIPIKLIAFTIWLAILFLPRYLGAKAEQRWADRIEEQLPPAIASIANGVQAGMTVVQAVQSQVPRAPEPIRSEFKVMLGAYGLGEDLPTVLREARARINLPGFTLVASALLTNRELGGDVGYTLDRLARALEGHKLMRHKVRSATSSGRANIKVLAVSPLVILGLMWFVDAEGVTLLFTTVAGQILLLLVALIAGAGIWWAWAIVNTDV
jgi:tight adherence protein B